MLATTCTFGLLYTRACNTWARAMSMLYFSAINSRFLAVNCFSASGSEMRNVSWASLCCIVPNIHVSTNAIRTNEVNVMVDLFKYGKSVNEGQWAVGSGQWAVSAHAYSSNAATGSCLIRVTKPLPLGNFRRRNQNVSETGSEFMFNIAGKYNGPFFFDGHFCLRFFKEGMITVVDDLY